MNCPLIDARDHASRGPHLAVRLELEVQTVPLRFKDGTVQRSTGEPRPHIPQLHALAIVVVQHLGHGVQPEAVVGVHPFGALRWTAASGEMVRLATSDHGIGQILHRPHQDIRLVRRDSKGR
jgi:hypothetical protein